MAKFGSRWFGWAAAVAALLVAASAWGQVKSLKAVAAGGVRYVALKDLAGMYGLPLTAPKAKTLLVAGQYVRLEFQEEGRQAVVNGTSVWLHTPVAKIRGQWSISDADAQYVIDPLVRPSAYLGGRGFATVALDAGHGGKDPGAMSDANLQEKDLSLDIARRVRAHLAAAGVRVAMTRDKDVFLELVDRPAAAAKIKADLFVSIHLNATGTKSVRGVETFGIAAAGFASTAGGAGSKAAVPNNQFNHSGTILAYQIQKALTGITRAEDRGVKRARFAVLRESKMPAALVECGFLTNPTEAQKLGTPSYRETVAQGVAQGILNYLALVRRAKGGAAAPVLQAPGAPMPGTTSAGVAGAVSAQGPTPTHNGPLPMASRDMGGKPGTAVPAGVRPGTVVGSSPGASAQPAGTTLSAPPPTAPAPTVAPSAAPQAAPAVPAAQGIQPAAGPLPPMGKAPGRPPVAVAPPPRSMLNPALMQHQP
jgi:N-acetylmuramoyl-L-alanine amidase